VLVLVDAPNVRRSLWPNLSPERLVELLAHYAAREGVHVVAVFDGPAPDVAAAVELVGTDRESADDWIARRAAELEEPFVLVTSDRELRERAGGRAERVIGGGSFARELSGFEPNRRRRSRDRFPDRRSAGGTC
jgi:predicted RNA-binding protein with PIN domain